MDMIPVGVDDGYGEIKIVLPDGSTFRQPTRVKAGIEEQVVVNDQHKDMFSYNDGDGNAYTAGNISDADSTAFDAFPLSAQNRVAVANALIAAGVTSNENLFICTGLPYKKYYRAGKPNKDLIKEKQANLMKNDITSIDGFSMPRIANHQVVSEGLAAWFDYIIDQNGSGEYFINDAKLNERIAYIDVGGRTTDIVVVREYIVDKRSHTEDLGMLDIHDEIKEVIEEELGTELDFEQIQQIMKTGKVRIWGQEQDVSPAVAQCLKSFATRLQSLVLKQLKKSANIDKVVFIGGTSAVIAPYVEGWFPSQEIHKDPAFANAWGMFKYVAMTLQKRKQKQNDK
ncbi:plasmid segregation protein ParM domain-containing protein [Neptuniibacter sp. QD37_11]|uniref:plasmid segregation protein ParM domain-containing protein n=1 Tax=Neptuniibacter sp. QD37_11 TaxID=3398209 RepID=UPI0039F50A75